LGYVGLPLAVYMARYFPVLGFDVDVQRISELQAGHDRTREVAAAEFAAAKNIRFSAEAAALEHRRAHADQGASLDDAAFEER